MMNFLKMLATPEFFWSIIRISAPIIFATLAAIVVEKAGFANIGLEGLMMFSALFGSLISYYTQNWFWGFIFALFVGVVMSLVMGFFAFKLKTDIILVGIAINMMGLSRQICICPYNRNYRRKYPCINYRTCYIKAYDTFDKYSDNQQYSLYRKSYFGTQPPYIPCVYLLLSDLPDAL